MGKINGCLKCIFIFFNIVFTILGVLLIAMAVHHGQVGAWTWLFALAVLGISCSGIYAGCSEKPIILKLFAGFMVGGMIVMMIIGITAAIAKNQIEKELETDSSNVAELLVEDPVWREKLNDLQIEWSCCGFYNVLDWGDEIPDSCECEPTPDDECQAKPQGSEGPDLVYETPCGLILSGVVYIAVLFVMGLSFGLAVIALIGLLISLLMLHQVNRPDDVRKTTTYY